MRRLILLLAASTSAACVPADEALELGSVSFLVVAAPSSENIVTIDVASDGHEWRIGLDRVVLGFRTMTIGKVGDDDRCAFRGRGERSDVVFDPRFGIEQTFNGIRPADCPDVGIFLAPPGDETDVGPGVTSRDLVDLAIGSPAHAIVEATARYGSESLRVQLRFDTRRTASRFGGCSDGSPPSRGIRVRANERASTVVKFAPENLFRDALGFAGRFRLAPFRLADERGNSNGIVTMEELDALALTRVRGFGDFYQLPTGGTGGSFGDFLRAQFRFTFFYGTSGACFGNEPGSAE